jgi:hypothetical protein
MFLSAACKGLECKRRGTEVPRRCDRLRMLQGGGAVEQSLGGAPSCVSTVVSGTYGDLTGDCKIVPRIGRLPGEALRALDAVSESG